MFRANWKIPNPGRKELTEERDVVVVGAGIAGCMAAATIALKGKGNVDVLLIDRNPHSEVGKKNTLGWVCGDAVGEHHIKFVHDHLGITYGLPEMENHVTAVYVFSPDMQVKVPFEGPGFVLDRPKFGRRLLQDALNAGVDYLGNAQATALIAESDKVVGLEGQTMENGTHKPLNALLKDWLATDPRFNEIQPLSDDSNLTGVWQVSVRHQNDCLVANGYMVCGDAAWFPNPISAGGIGPGLIGGVMAGETAVRAVEADDFSEGQLWEYNLDFVHHYGNKTAALEAFRLYLQTLNNKEINYGMRHFLSSKEATEMSLGEMPHFSAFQKIVKLLQGLGSYKAFKGLVFTIEKMRTLNELYQNYPKDPSEFEGWKSQVDSILHEVRT